MPMVPCTSATLQAYEAAFEEVAEAHFAPSVVVCVADYKAREYEEEINCNMSVVQCGYEAVASSVCCLGKGKAFENVIPKYKQGGNTAQTVK